MTFLVVGVQLPGHEEGGKGNARQTLVVSQGEASGLFRAHARRSAPDSEPEGLGCGPASYQLSRLLATEELKALPQSVRGPRGGRQAFCLLDYENGRVRGC